jgi:hypothetical protein
MNDIYFDPRWFQILATRNELLQNSDWTQLPDVELTAEQVQAMKTYRQQLRDLTKDFTNPDDVIFPVNPLESNS